MKKNILLDNITFGFIFIVYVLVFFVHLKDNSFGNTVKESISIEDTNRKTEEQNNLKNEKEIKKPVYIPAFQDTKEGKMPITFYYPNQNQRLLIPVTKFIPYSEHVLLTTIQQLTYPMYKELGLSTVVPVEGIRRVDIEEDKVIIDLDSQAIAFDNIEQSNIFFSSIYHSIKQFSSFRKVQFLVDGKKEKTIFYGVSYFDECIEFIYEPEVYLGYFTKNRIYLAPLSLYKINPSILEKDAIEKVAQEIFKYLQNGYEYNGIYCVGLVPKDVKLLDIRKEKNVLHLSFSKEIIHSFGKEYDKKRMMLDGIIYSFTSIPDVEYVKLTIDQNEVKEFMGINLEKEIKAFKGINPIL